MRFEQFNSQAGRDTIAEKARFFAEMIERQSLIYGENLLQTPESLLELWLLMMVIRPRSVFELGTAQRSSTIALALGAAALPDCKVYGVDIAPRDFSEFAAQNYPDLHFGAVVDIAVEATTFEIPDEWCYPIFMFYDAHDGGIPDKVISRHAISRWFPKLSGQTIAIHDCARAPLPEEEYLPQYTEATHWGGETIIGFPEVGPLVEWMNEARISFWRPADELARIGVVGTESDTIVLTVP